GRGDEAPPLPRDLPDSVGEQATSSLRVAGPPRRRLRRLRPGHDRDAGFHDEGRPPLHGPPEPPETEHRGGPRCPRPRGRIPIAGDELPRAPEPRPPPVPDGPAARGTRIPPRFLGPGPRARRGRDPPDDAGPHLLLHHVPRRHERDVLRRPEGGPLPRDEPRGQLLARMPRPEHD